MDIWGYILYLFWFVGVTQVIRGGFFLRFVGFLVYSVQVCYNKVFNFFFRSFGYLQFTCFRCSFVCGIYRVIRGYIDFIYMCCSKYCCFVLGFRDIRDLDLIFVISGFKFI